MISGLIKEIKPVKQLLEDTMTDADAVYKELKGIFE